jgi:plastocyanin
VRRLLAIAIVGVFALGAATAWGGPGPPKIVAEDDTFAAANQQSDEGELVLFDNNGPNHIHNATADEDGPDGKPLFRTGDVSPPAMDRPVNGTQFLEARTYVFHCTIHPSTMESTLTVNPSASGPLPRPEISLRVKSKKLEKVVKSGKLKVKVSAAQPTDAEGIELKAKKGRKTIAKESDFAVGAGNEDTAKLKLTKKGGKLLADLDKAKVKVAGTVDFGFGDKASKKLK